MIPSPYDYVSRFPKILSYLLFLFTSHLKGCCPYWTKSAKPYTQLMQRLSRNVTPCTENIQTMP